MLFLLKKLTKWFNEIFRELLKHNFLVFVIVLIYVIFIYAYLIVDGPFSLIFFLGVAYVYFAKKIEHSFGISWPVSIGILLAISPLVPFSGFLAVLLGGISIKLFFSLDNKLRYLVLGSFALTLGLIRVICLILTFGLLGMHPVLIRWDDTSGPRLKKSNPILYYLGYSYGYNDYFAAQINSKAIRAKKELESIKDGKIVNMPDIFDPQQNYKISQLHDGTIIFYSIGPAEKDYKGQILYDPSNGCVSDGNILAFKKQ